MIKVNEPAMVITMAELEELMQKVADLAVAKALSKAQDQDEMWDAARVGAYLGVSAWTVRYRKAQERGFPKAIKVGRAPLWRAADVRKYVDKKVT
ncbi:AlpA family transcriptional regulator [Methylococcus sp. EFPC2]|uniref:helix-turn-helix transcriptional regulator n=1 Tax=Methylococcus sp. EFPC2 TaxID=2812648 RepID=UPI0019672471|nr:hypothetical protein [Methylococcus sp. EFPC2]QSA98811.1 hypothetical protein JWZ97_08555 [Methylococcus sp. EFPC2]